MTWSAESMARAEQIIARYPEKRSAVMPLLYVAMKEDGYLSDEGMAIVGELTGLTSAQVQSVATFYVMYKTEPKGTYLISVCTSISCFLMGADEVLRAIEDAAGIPAGETDGTLAVEHAECVGACGGAPACLINYELVEGLRPEKSVGLCRWLRDAQPEVVLGDEMQQLFGGQKSFPWGPAEQEGAVAAVLAFGPYGSAEDGR